jgi:hypothetical protein
MKKCGHLLRKKLTRLAIRCPEMSSQCVCSSLIAHPTAVVSLGIAKEESEGGGGGGGEKRKE